MNTTFDPFHATTPAEHIAIIRYWWAAWLRVPTFRPETLRARFDARLARYGGEPI